MNRMEFRYLPMTEQDERDMLHTIGVESIDNLLEDIPATLRESASLSAIGAPLPEVDLVRHMTKLAEKNMHTKSHPSFLGAGMYDHLSPSVMNHMLLRSEFYTAYTPYQPEISQGELQAMFEFQTMICELTGMDVANSSLAEATYLASAHTKKKRVVVSGAVHPEAKDVIRTYAAGPGLDVDITPVVDGLTSGDLDLSDASCLVVQYPNFYGRVEDLASLAKMAHDAGALFVVSSNPLALGVLESPGALGADITVGDAQPFGIPQSFGGPSCGYFAVKKALMRKLPGRLVGQTVDEDGKRGFVLTLQAREQHIRRDKATSNICSNQALNALAASITMSALGKYGIRDMAVRNMQTAHYMKESLKSAGYAIIDEGPMFNEFVVDFGVDADDVSRHLLDHGIIGGLPLGTYEAERRTQMLVCATELRTKEEIDQFVEVVGGMN